METKRNLLEGETLIWQGRPTWRAYAGLTILGWVLAPAVLGLVVLAVLGIKKRSIGWMLSNRRIEIETGWLSRKIDTLELWRKKDVEFEQGLWDRLLGVSSIRITAQDENDATLAIVGLPGDRAVYDQLSNAVMTARQQRNVLSLTP